METYKLEHGPHAGQDRQAIFVGKENGVEYYAVFTLPSDKQGYNGVLRATKGTDTPSVTPSPPDSGDGTPAPKRRGRPPKTPTADRGSAA